MRPISFQKVDSTIIAFDARLTIFKKKILNNLDSLIFPRTPKDKKAYINHIKINIDKIIAGKPEVINTLKAEFDAILTPKLMASKAYIDFKDKILGALEYASRRSDFYPKYFHQLGIKACVYCNAQLAVTIEEKVNLKTKTRIDYTAKFQVDHFLPKADYPCFSISLYNLYPVCANCNIAKSKSIVDFNLYSDEQNLTSNGYKFDLEKGTVAKYLISRNVEDIQYKFLEPMVLAPTKSFQEVFKIQEIYDTQKGRC
ncbi:HNH endonuclease [Sphingobacterium sp. E70]|uniref:HNH endonuclease signature motif containing protein n=1 Tax=Sphingobacterium sp. E70 TaxID=2853439 RepID=UPI00211C86E8|nr:HNH endonuclease signature motif containing protein [Sphingobacterium sp. E70]ULT26861.1 HNH endonuclease [Sphingobacterium sp. E70]